MARIGVVAANMSGLTFPELQDLAKSAEAAGFESIFSPEFMKRLTDQLPDHGPGHLAD